MSKTSTVTNVFVRITLCILFIGVATTVFTTIKNISVVIYKEVCVWFVSSAALTLECLVIDCLLAGQMDE